MERSSEMRWLRSLPRIDAVEIGAEWRCFDGPSVLVIASGEAMVRAGDEFVRAGLGDLVCAPPAVQCSLRRVAASARIARLEADAVWVERALELAGWSDRKCGGPDAIGFRVDRSGTDRARRAARLLREVEAARSSQEGAPLRLAGRCIELLGLALALPAGTCASGEAARGLGRRERFLRAVEALRQDSFGDLSLPVFARRAGLSQRHASRLFQLEFGRSFREYVAELRLERAKALLRETGLSVIEVAGETGWSSLAHFNSVFRRRVGSTPSQFRSGRAPARRARIAS